MKHLFTLVRSLLLIGLFWKGIPAAHAQAPAWQTAAAIGTASNGAYTVTATAPDATGTNFYVTGYFAGTVAIGGALLTSAGGNDVFVAKWSVASRSFAWVQRAGGTNNDQALALTVRGVSVFVAGTFGVAASFGTINLTSGGATDGFVVKLADAGSSASFVWAQAVGGLNEDRATALDVSGANVYLTGTFRSQTATLGTLTITNNTATGTTAGLAHVFLSKLTDAGTTSSFVWARAFGGAAADDAAAALVANGNSIYLAGDYTGNLNLGSTTLSSSGGRDVYVLKFMDGGNNPALAWAKSAGGATADLATALALNGTSVYVAGQFSGLAIFDVNGVVSAGTANMFVAKLDDAGTSSTFVWAQQGGGTASDQATALAVSGTGVYVAGSFTSGTAAFGSTNLTNASSATARPADIFVTRLNDSGPAATFSWAQKAGGMGADQATSLLVLGNTVVVGGSVTPPATFGTQSITTAATVSVGFLASLATASPLATADAAVLANLSLYPNPTHDRASTQLPAIPGATTATLTVLDAVGRTVRTQTAATNANTELDLTGLAPGLYAVRVQAGSRSATQRLVVE